jgi:glyoxylase-like metal-dependent hydrolase (beta-lactamase superfamily II)
LTLECLTRPGGRWVRTKCHALVALLRHPRVGWVLWDSGYAPRLLDATRRLPFRLYRLATPLRLRADLTVVAQLSRLGLSPADVRWVVLSHLHADHIAGLRDLPDARIVLSEAAYTAVRGLHGTRALRRAFIPSLLPDDFLARAVLLPPFDGPDLGPLGSAHDLFGDGSMLLINWPGPSADDFSSSATPATTRPRSAGAVYRTA